MKPQKQLYRHNPEQGVYGDCHRTAIAIVLDLDAEDVPHFMDGNFYRKGGGPKANDLFEAWLNERGIATISFPFPGESLARVLDTIAACNPLSKPAFLLLGTSRTGVNHCVVACDGEIVCDPSLDDAGIIGPCDDGHYWVTFFGLLDATKDPARRDGLLSVVDAEIAAMESAA